VEKTHIVSLIQRIWVQLQELLYYLGAIPRGLNHSKVQGQVTVLHGSMRRKIISSNLVRFLLVPYFLSGQPQLGKTVTLYSIATVPIEITITQESGTLEVHAYLENENGQIQVAAGQEAQVEGSVTSLQ
jgi:hypothetical protein